MRQIKSFSRIIQILTDRLFSCPISSARRSAVRRFLTALCILTFSMSGLSAQSFTVSPGIPFRAEDLERVITLSAEKRAGTEILVYGYTPVTEIYSLSSDESLSERLEEGELRAMVKTMKNGAIEKAVFVKGRGLTESEIVKSLADAVAASLAE